MRFILERDSDRVSGGESVQSQGVEECGRVERKEGVPFRFKPERAGVSLVDAAHGGEQRPLTEAPSTHRMPRSRRLR